MNTKTNKQNLDSTMRGHLKVSQYVELWEGYNKRIALYHQTLIKPNTMILLIFFGFVGAVLFFRITPWGIMGKLFMGLVGFGAGMIAIELAYRLIKASWSFLIHLISYPFRYVEMKRFLKEKVKDRCFNFCWTECGEILGIDVCKIGVYSGGNHDWDGCKCRHCGLERDEQHDWDWCKCRRCGKERNIHDWEEKSEMAPCQRPGGWASHGGSPSYYTRKILLCRKCGKKIEGEMADAMLKLVDEENNGVENNGVVFPHSTFD